MNLAETKQRFCVTKSYDLTPQQLRERFILWKKADSKTDINAAKKIGIDMEKNIEYAHILDEITGKCIKISKEQLLFFFEDKIAEIADKPTLISNNNCSKISIDPRCYLLRLKKNYQRKKAAQFSCLRHDTGKYKQIESDFISTVNNISIYLEKHGNVLPKLKLIGKKMDNLSSSSSSSSSIININGNDETEKKGKKKITEKKKVNKKRKIEKDVSFHLNELAKFYDMEKTVSNSGKTIYKFTEREFPKK